MKKTNFQIGQKIRRSEKPAAGSPWVDQKASVVQPNPFAETLIPMLPAMVDHGFLSRKKLLTAARIVWSLCQQKQRLRNKGRLSIPFWAIFEAMRAEPGDSD